MLASTTRTSDKINQNFTGSNGAKVLVTGNGDQPGRLILVTYPDGMKASVTVEVYDDGGAVFLTGGKIGNQTMTPCMLSEMRKMLPSAGMPNVILSKSEEATSRPTPLPGDFLGSNGKPSGKRINTDLPGINLTPDELFEKLTGGKSKPRPRARRLAITVFEYVGLVKERDHAWIFQQMVVSHMLLFNFRADLSYDSLHPFKRIYFINIPRYSISG